MEIKPVPEIEAMDVAEHILKEAGCSDVSEADVDEQLIDYFGIDGLEALQFLLGVLLPMTNPVKSPLTGQWFNALGVLDRASGTFTALAKREVPKTD